MKEFVDNSAVDMTFHVTGPYLVENFFAGRVNRVSVWA